MDVRVNNLGIFAPQPFEAITDDDRPRFFEASVLGGVRLARAYLPGMRARDWGRVVFVSSARALQIPAATIVSVCSARASSTNGAALRVTRSAVRLVVRATSRPLPPPTFAPAHASGAPLSWHRRRSCST